MSFLNRDALQKAYGAVPADLAERTRQTLVNLPQGESARSAGAKKRFVTLAVVLGLLVIGTAVAIGLHSEFTRRLDLPEAVEPLVQTPDPATASAVTDMATFTVDSCLFDGISVMADVRVEPARSGIWILPSIMEQSLELNAANLGITGSDLTIREYAESMGIRQIRFVQISNATDGDSLSNMWIQAQPYLGEDGMIHYLLTTALLSEARQEMDFTMRFYVLFGAQPREDTITLHLTADAIPEQQKSPLSIDVLGVTVQQIHIIRTPAASYYRMIYTGNPPKGELFRVALQLLNADKRPIFSNLWEGGNFNHEFGTGVLQGVLPAAAESNGQITFRMLVEGQWSEPITVALPGEK